MGFGVVLSVFFLVVFAIIAVIGFFVNQIILFDNILLSIAGAAALNLLCHIHPAICLLAGLILFGLLYVAQTFKIGFFIIGGIFSLFWSFCFGMVAYMFSEGDMLWFYVIWGLGFIGLGYLHYRHYPY